MSLRKAIASGKEHRKGHVCPSGRDCGYCQDNRTRSHRRQAEQARFDQAMAQDLLNGEPVSNAQDFATLARAIPGVREVIVGENSVMVRVACRQNPEARAVRALEYDLPPWLDLNVWISEV